MLKKKKKVIEQLTENKMNFCAGSEHFTTSSNGWAHQSTGNDNFGTSTHLSAQQSALTSPFYTQNMMAWRSYDSSGYQRASHYGMYVTFNLKIHKKY